MGSQMSSLQLRNFCHRAELRQIQGGGIPQINFGIVVVTYGSAALKVGAIGAELKGQNLALRRMHQEMQVDLCWKRQPFLRACRKQVQFQLAVISLVLGV